VYPERDLLRGDIPLAREYIFAKDDSSAFHLLLCIREIDPAEYARIPPVIKLHVLCSRLRYSQWLEDWGEMADPTSLGDAGTALLALGKQALPCLFSQLEDNRPILTTIGEAVVEVEMCNYRHKDVAYKYIELILGRQPVYSENPVERDRAIKALLEEQDNLLSEKRDD
jgi:hypothetical protein